MCIHALIVNILKTCIWLYEISLFFTSFFFWLRSPITYIASAMTDNAKLVAECENLIDKDEFHEVYNKLNGVQDMSVELMSLYAKAIRYMGMKL